MSYDRLNLAFRFGDISHHYYDLFARKDWIDAAWFLYMINSSLPGKAMLEDLPEPSVDTNTHEDELTIDEQYMEYCRNWGPKVMQAIAVYEERKQAQYQQNSGYMTD